MDEQFFEEGEYQQTQHPVTQTQQTHHQPQQNQWEEAESPSTPVQQSTLYMMGSQNAYSSNIVPNLGSSSAIEVDDEVTRKIAEQQNRINQILREKSAKEYEEKQARKALGREQLQQFFSQKEKQLEERRQQNIEHENKLLERSKELSGKAGWGRVFQNVNLKLGEYQGTKNVNRMREAIINKHEDDKNRQ